MEALKRFMELVIIRIGEYEIRIITLTTIFIIFLITNAVLWIIKKALFRKHKIIEPEIGNIYALFKIIKYTIWIISISLILNAIGISVTVLLAGSAALLVGVGLGLQQTFNDILSGIILLSERSIRIGDILEIDGDIVKIQNIGLRTSTGLNRDEISIIIPNSIITTNKVINWSHQSMKTRFKINVGTAYGSDVELVIKILEESAMEHPDIEDRNLVEARIIDFGNSSLDFQLLFFSENIFRIERVKSDIRKIINRKFVEYKITIPFPQMDVHLEPGNNINKD
jgi:small-conductance mechanosensitive channel